MCFSNSISSVERMALTSLSMPWVTEDKRLPSNVSASSRNNTASSARANSNNCAIFFDVSPMNLLSRSAMLALISRLPILPANASAVSVFPVPGAP
ncbi:hypothetical protein D3C73_1413410 [compost metagenome]